MVSAGLWAIAVYAALMGGALAVVNLYGQTVLPFYRWELSWIAPQYHLLNFDVVHLGSQPMFNATVDDEFVSEDGEVLHPGSFRGSYKALVMDGLQHVLLVLFVPLAWPGLAWKQRLTGLMFTIPVLFILEFVDVPWAMLGGLDAGKAHIVHCATSSATVWRDILSTGERSALGLAGGLIACGTALTFQRSRAPEPRWLRRRRSRLRSAR
jgi:hypothetical protein